MLRFHSVACIFYSYVAGDMYVGGLYADALIHSIYFLVLHVLATQEELRECHEMEDVLI